MPEICTRRVPRIIWARAGYTFSKEFEPNERPAHWWSSKEMYLGLVRRWARKIGPVGLYLIWMPDAPVPD